jgi:DinB family.
MAETKLPEVWLRGALPGIPAQVQPVAHALLQAQEEIHALMNHFPDELLWERPAQVASPGFHLQHIAGVLDRLFTYAKGEQLSAQQLDYLKAEGQPLGTTDSLLQALDKQIEISIAFLKSIDPTILVASRGVGRKLLPSTVMGLLFHATEHTMRHTGQLIVTVRVLLQGRGGGMQNQP